MISGYSLSSSNTPSGIPLYYYFYLLFKTKSQRLASFPSYICLCPLKQAIEQYWIEHCGHLYLDLPSSQTWHCWAIIINIILIEQNVIRSDVKISNFVPFGFEKKTAEKQESYCHLLNMFQSKMLKIFLI